MSWEAREEQEIHPPGLKAVSSGEGLCPATLLAQQRLTSPLGRTVPCPGPTSCWLCRSSQGWPWSHWGEPITVPPLFLKPLLNFSPTWHSIWRMSWGISVIFALMVVKRSKDIAVSVCTSLLLGSRWTKGVLKPHKEQRAASISSSLHHLASQRT